jgi:RNA polymerase sigma-70 factor (ECF subfamily)
MADTEAFEQFMKSHQNMVYSVAVRLLGNESDAADISQEAFLKAYDHFAKLEHNPSAPGWLRTVATNLSLNHLTRYRARWRFFSDFLRSDRETSLENLIPDPTCHTEKEEQQFRRQYLETALRQLPSSQRVPLVLYHFEEMSYEEIASRLRISLSKVKTDIHRARESLRRWLRPDMDQWEEQIESRLPDSDARTPSQQNRVPCPARSPSVFLGLERIDTA